jgi:hypothetical protein
MERGTSEAAAVSDIERMLRSRVRPHEFVNTGVEMEGGNAI